MSEEITHQFLRNGFDQILARLDSMDSHLGNLNSRTDSLDSRLLSLEETVERRLQETRPIWEQVLKRLDGVETRLGGVEARLEKVEHELYSLGKKFRLFNQDILDLQNAQEDVDERLTNLETRRNS